MLDALDNVYGYLDLEVDPKESKIYRVGFVSPLGAWDVGMAEADVVRSHLLQLHAQGGGVCGHNIRRFDYPYLVREWPDLKPLPAIDTLELSVLAFPLQPSHQLQKDYKLSDYASNQPLEDAQATRLLLQHCLETMRLQPEPLQHAYRWLLTCGQEEADRAYQQLFTTLDWAIAPLSLAALPDAAIAGMPQPALESLWADLRSRSFGDRLILAAFLAWNWHRTTTASNQAPCAWLSYLPNFYGLRELLFPVVANAFTYQSYFHAFGIEQFRDRQEDAVRAIIDGENPLILMATGGGKSLCYQLPALMYYRQQRGLTVCISPLQALMEDQVEDLQERGLDFATFINGTLQAEERRQRLEQIRNGWKGLLYISPEQLRSLGIRNVLQECLPTLWIIDEAHCISQWGHDFRPDYRYVPKFIAALYGDRQLPLPRIALLTATATTAVRADLKQLFAEFGLPIQQEIQGPSQRPNLQFEVIPVADKRSKDKALFATLQTLLEQGHLTGSAPIGFLDSEKSPVEAAESQNLPANFGEQPNGCILIYTTTRKDAERLAQLLNQHQIPARHYHGKISREDKSEILRAFKAGELNVITATCAFGMGINRKDVRAVLHYTMSSSLEAYTQEAGRAGRDGEAATCTLLFHRQDADTIFFLKSLNQLSLLELRSIFDAIRKVRDRIIKSNKPHQNTSDQPDKQTDQGDRDSWFWVTPDEIFQTSELDDTFAEEADQRQTKIAVALHYLEQFQLIERAENLSSFVQFSLEYTNPQQSCQVFEAYARAHDLSELQTEQFRRLIYAMHLIKFRAHDGGDRFSLDVLSDDSGIPVHELTSRIRELQQAGICSTSNIPLSLLITKRRDRTAESDARNLHDRLRIIEEAFLEELLPLMGEENRTQINLKGMATRLTQYFRLMTAGDKKSQTDFKRKNKLEKSDFLDVSVYKLIKILDGWQLLKWVKWQRVGPNQAQLEQLEVADWLTRHQTLSSIILDIFYEKLDQSDQEIGKNLVLDFDLGDLLSKVQGQTKPMNWSELDIRMTLLWLHQHQILRLTEGLTLFRHSFKLKTILTKTEQNVEDDQEKKIRAKDIRIIDRQYPRVQAHYQEQARRTHLMVEYGKMADEQERQTFLDHYFNSEKSEFEAVYPHFTTDAIARPVLQEDYDRIMLPLNPAQREIVLADDPAMVVIAGPGSGKTRTIVHRIAYLVKVKRVSPDRILVLAYNRNAVYALRQRLKDLIGPIAYALRVFTFHGLALALLGYVPGVESRDRKVNFDQLLQEAIALLESTDDPDNLAGQAQVANVLGTIEYIFVDEYQDVASAPYRLIQLVSGLGQADDEPSQVSKKSGKTKEQAKSVRINLCAIGDDDQTINEFAGANSRFILDFEVEYTAERLLLTENYRSTEAIIAAANALIAHNPQRCKRTPEEQVQINRERQGQTGAAVEVLQFATVGGQADWIRQQVQDWLAQGIAGNEIAILAHQWKLLSPARALLEQAGITTYALKNDGIPLVRNWVTCKLIDKLKAAGAGRVLLETESVRSRFLTQFQAWGCRETEPTVQTLLKIADTLDAERNFGTEEAIATSADEILTSLFEFNQSGTSFEQEKAVLVTSCHSAKGLEFRHVILLTDGFETRADKIEAERRLLYVAMTRAKEKLILCGTQSHQLLQETGIMPQLRGDRDRHLPHHLLYLDLTPADVQLGHPATQDQQALITGLREGEPLQLVATRSNDGWTIRSDQGQILGMLSRSAMANLQRHNIHAGRFQFQPGEVTIRYIYRHLKIDEITEQMLEDWFVVIPQIRVCR